MRTQRTPQYRDRVTERPVVVVNETSARSLPIWIRPPVTGLEPHTGLSRGMLYQLAARGLIKTASLRGEASKGVRVFHLPSILAYLERCVVPPIRAGVAAPRSLGTPN